MESEAQRSLAAEDGWSPKSPRPVLGPRQDGRRGQRAPGLHPACSAPGGLRFCLPGLLPAVRTVGAVWPLPGPPSRWGAWTPRGPALTLRSRPPPALTPTPLALPAEENYGESRYHFLHSSDGEGCADMLVEYSTARGFRGEADMFVAQAVLQ